MYLSSVVDLFSVSIKQDTEFMALGLITHQRPQLLSYIVHKDYLPYLSSNKNIAAVFTTADIAEYIPDEIGVIICDSPKTRFFQFHNFLASETDFYWASFPTKISSKAFIHPLSYIAENNVVIGDDVIIEQFVSIQERTIINRGTIIQAGATIGTDGFEYHRTGSEVMRIIHGGGTLIGEFVDVQCHANVDRSIFGGFTRVGNQAKISKYAHIAHHVVVGQRAFIAANSVVSGSTTIGDDVWVGPGSIISSELIIGKGAKISLGSVVTTDIGEGMHVSGNFAVEHEKYINFIKSIR